MIMIDGTRPRVIGRNREPYVPMISLEKFSKISRSRVDLTDDFIDLRAAVFTSHIGHAIRHHRAMD